MILYELSSTPSIINKLGCYFRPEFLGRTQIRSVFCHCPPEWPVPENRTSTQNSCWYNLCRINVGIQYVRPGLHTSVALLQHPRRYQARLRKHTQAKEDDKFFEQPITWAGEDDRTTLANEDNSNNVKRAEDANQYSFQATSINFEARSKFGLFRPHCSKTCS